MILSDKEFPLEVETQEKSDHALTFDVGSLIKKITICNLSEERRWHMIQRTPDSIIVFDVDEPQELGLINPLILPPDYREDEN